MIKSIPTIALRPIREGIKMEAIQEFERTLIKVLAERGYVIKQDDRDSSEQPDFLINLSSPVDPSIPVLYFADMFEDPKEVVEEFINSRQEGVYKLIVLHQFKNKITSPDVVYINFFDSDISELMPFIEENLIHKIPMFALNQKSNRLFAENKNSIHLFTFDLNETRRYFLFLSSERDYIPLSKEEYLIASEFHMKDEAVIPESERNVLEKINGLILRESFVERKIQKQIEDGPVFINEGKYIISFTGDGKCNLRCNYCFGEEENPDEVVKEGLTPEVIHKMFDLILNKLPVKPELICVDFMIGSEPTIRIEDYYRLFEICRTYQKTTNIQIVLGYLTNGTLFSDDIIDVFDKDIRWLGFSIDGDEATHNGMRVFPSGRGTYDIVLRNAKRILDLNWPIVPGASAVITSRNMNLLQTFLHLWDIGFRTIVMRPPRISADWEFSINANNIAELEQSYIELAQFLLDKAKEGDLSYLKAFLVEHDYFGRYLVRTLYNTRIYLRNCSAGNTMLCIRNDGSIYSCVSLNALEISRIGDVYNGITSTFNIENVTDIELCKECWARFQCGGLCCHLKQIDCAGEIVSVDCRLNKFLIELSISLCNELKCYLTDDDFLALRKHISLCNFMYEDINERYNFAFGPR